MATGQFTLYTFKLLRQQFLSAFHTEIVTESPVLGFIDLRQIAYSARCRSRRCHYLLRATPRLRAYKPDKEDLSANLPPFDAVTPLHFLSMQVVLNPRLTFVSHATSIQSSLPLFSRFHYILVDSHPGRPELNQAGRSPSSCDMGFS